MMPYNVVVLYVSGVWRDRASFPEPGEAMLELTREPDGSIVQLCHTHRGCNRVYPRHTLWDTVMQWLHDDLHSFKCYRSKHDATCRINSIPAAKFANTHDRAGSSTAARA